MKKISPKLSFLIVTTLTVIIIINRPVFGSNPHSATVNPLSHLTIQQDKEITITITLTNGTTRTGILVAQTKNTITIRTEDGTEVIQKKYIVETNPPLPGLQTKPRRSIRRRTQRTTYQPTKPQASKSTLPYNRFNLSLGVGMVGGVQLPETIYEDGYNDEYFSLEETTWITPDDFPTSMAISLGFTVYFSRNLGISLSLHYITKKTFDILSSYNYYINVPGSGSYEDQDDWYASGEISMMPITLNLVYRFNIGPKANINIFAGPALIFANIDLLADMGYGVVFEDELYLYPEWWPIPLYISASETIVGGNAGLDIEYRINDRIGLCVGFSYFFAGEKDYLWEIDNSSVPISSINSLPMDILEDYMGILNDLEVYNTIQFSFFKAFFGIKLYL